MSFSVSRVNWEQAAPLLKNIREKVFICEWRIPRSIEFDRNDRKAYHMLVCDDSTQEPVATGRIMPSGEISRIAVVINFRDKHIDRIIFSGLIKIAKELQLDEVFIISSLEAVDYYRKHNFTPSGAVFMEAGIPRQRMSCRLNNLDIEDTNYLLNH
ncbi:GNAT family N-acetyltransferase [Thalassotalea fusca]